MTAVRFQAKVYKTKEGWICEVLEPDDDGFYVKLAEYHVCQSWDEALELALWWAT